jgi:hypothetical protein
MPDECKIGIEVNPKVVLGKSIIRGTSRYPARRARARRASVRHMDRTCAAMAADRVGAIRNSSP